MQGKRSIVMSLCTSVEKQDATKSTKLDFSVSFSIADIFGIALCACGLLSNSLYYPYAAGEPLAHANVLFIAFALGQIPLFAAVAVFDRAFVHAGRKLYVVLAGVFALLSLASSLAPVVDPDVTEASIALWVVTGIGYGGLLLMWGTRVVVFQMKRVGFHAMAATLLGSAFFFVIMLLDANYAEHIVVALLPVASAFCFVRASNIFSDEYPPMVRIKRVYERKLSFVKLVIFCAVYAIAYGLCFSYLPVRGIGEETLALSYGLGFSFACAWLFINLFIIKRSVPTNAMVLLSLFLLSAGIILFIDNERLLVVALALLVAFFLLHLDQCLRKTLKCTNAFQGKFFKLLSVICLVNLIGLAAGCLVGNILLSTMVVGIAEKSVFFWLVAVALVFDTMLCSVDFEKKPATYSIFSSQGSNSSSRGDAVVVSALIKSIATDYGLSIRQTEVLSMLAKGRNASVIERELVISSNTAKSHIYTVYQKLGVHSQQELLDFIEGHRQA